MRHDPDPCVLKAAREGRFRDVVAQARRLAGLSADEDEYHRVSLELDTVFGAYHNLEIACTKPAAVALERAGLTAREAELIGDWWLRFWREGRTKNCPRNARRTNDDAANGTHGQRSGYAAEARPESVDRGDGGAARDAG